MGLNYFASSPVLVMPQQQPHYFMHHPHNDSSNCITMVDQPQARRFAPKLPTPPPSINYLAQASHRLAGRKRSRADIGDDHEAELEASAGPVQPPKPKVEPRLGPGMTLIYDEPDLNISPDSQSGTWLEEKADIDAASAAAALVDRPRIPARKSSRRISVDENLESTVSTDIDPIVLQLGIGWKRMSEAQAASVAGDEAFIRNQYPYVQSPKLLLHHEGLAIYVVRSNPIDMRAHQWWLFKEDLKSCRLLCNSNEDDVLRRLGNKRQDERGNWVPEILADGQVIYAKDAVQPLTPQTDGPTEDMEIDV
jgi:hypothetical protein